MRLVFAFLVLASLRGSVFAQRTEGAGESTQPFVMRTEEPGSYFGSAATGVGDVDGDGFDDMMVGAPRFGPADDGKAYLYRGGAPMSPIPAWTFRGGLDEAYCGTAVAGAGDVNGDGYADVVLGLPGLGAGAGAAIVLHGSPAGLGAWPDWTILGAEPGAYLGSSVCGAGDVDGDGYDDVVVGAPGFGTPGSAGRAQVFRGGPGGLDTTPWWEVVGAPGDELGYQVSGVGDVDGDGYDDLLIGSWSVMGSDAVRLYRGGPGGLVPVPAPLGSSCLVFFEDAAGAGDLNGDGLADLIVTGWLHSQCRAVHLGAPGGFTGAVWFDSVFGAQGNAVGLGDFDGDGFGDLVAGRGGAYPGGAEFYRGTSTGLEATSFLTVPSPFYAYYGFWPYSWAYVRVGAAGDVNGDGLADAILGDPVGAPGGRNEHVQIVLGPGAMRTRRFR